MSNKLRPNPPVVCRNPKTGQVMETTSKLFYSIYRDKGFELVTRDNFEPDARAEPSKRTTVRNGEPKSSLGSASAVAAALNIDPKSNQDPNAEKGVAGSEAGKNEIDANTDGSVITDEREPNKRDRGRNS